MRHSPRTGLLRCQNGAGGGGQPFLGDDLPFGSALGVARNNGYLPFIQELNLPGH